MKAIVLALALSAGGYAEVQDGTGMVLRVIGQHGGVATVQTCFGERKFQLPTTLLKPTSLDCRSEPPAH